MSNWTFLTNYAAVLVTVAKHGRIKALDIALELGLTERTVRRIIADLAAEGYIRKTRENNVNRYEIEPDLRLRQQAMRDITIQDFVRLFSPSSQNRSL
jgi:predicted ArsR family transcriptional regulator